MNNNEKDEFVFASIALAVFFYFGFMLLIESGIRHARNITPLGPSDAYEDGIDYNGDMP